MIYVRQENELAFTPLHLVPPTSLGLLDAVRFALLNQMISPPSAHYLTFKSFQRFSFP